MLLAYCDGILWPNPNISMNFLIMMLVNWITFWKVFIRFKITFSNGYFVYSKKATGFRFEYITCSEKLYIWTLYQTQPNNSTAWLFRTILPLQSQCFEQSLNFGFLDIVDCYPGIKTHSTVDRKVRLKMKNCDLKWLCNSDKFVRILYCRKLYALSLFYYIA